jgi:hypothetical protein
MSLERSMRVREACELRCVERLRTAIRALPEEEKGAASDLISALLFEPGCETNNTLLRMAIDEGMDEHGSRAFLTSAYLAGHTSLIRVLLHQDRWDNAAMRAFGVHDTRGLRALLGLPGRLQMMPRAATLGWAAGPRAFFDLVYERAPHLFDLEEAVRAARSPYLDTLMRVISIVRWNFTEEAQRVTGRQLRLHSAHSHETLMEMTLLGTSPFILEGYNEEAPM